MAPSTHQQSLAKYAEAAIKVGLNLRAGQRLIITNGTTRGVPVHAAPLVREVVRAAYRAGARYVDVIWNDEELLLTRFQHAPRDSFDEYPKWHITGIMDMIEHGDAVLAIRSNNPDLLGDQDPELVAAWQKAHLQNYKPINDAVGRNAVNWCVIAAASPAWAAMVFPEVAAGKREAKLWEAIFEITRVDRPDPVAAWMDHIRDLTARGRYMTAKQYSALHYSAPGTNLTLGLPRGHIWLSARMTAQNGVDYTANMPTEETFTLPDRARAEGTVTAALPLSYGGTLIEDFSLTFEKGRIVKVSARKGEAALQKLVETDEGASRLGEAALVPHSSPIAKRGRLFFDTLIDENAASHLAIGDAYNFTLKDGENLSAEEFNVRGGNTSITHVDFMVGSAKMDIDGIREDGTTEPVMRQGEWAFDT